MRKQKQKTIAEYEVHIWQASLLMSGQQIAVYFEGLSPAEQKRAQQFHFDKHRKYFIAAHGFLRQVLSDYIALPP